jgi:negative regulator of sigma-B (phosphoserine phosphatase)
METIASSVIEWGVASRALPGQLASGDLSLVKPFPDGVLVAALDGLGHGEEAASAAAVAAETLETNVAEPVMALVQRCHEALRTTRGVAMSIASFDASRGLVTWLGVGNVVGVLLRRGFTRSAGEIPLLLRPGVAGFQLPSLDAEVLSVSAGDTLIFATDGIKGDFDRGLARNCPPQMASERILTRHARETDDALVLVVRYLRDSTRE